MKAHVVIALVGVVIGSVATAPVAHGEESAWRNPASERVTFVGGVGYLEPLGQFGDTVDGGVLVSAGGFYRLIEYVAPEFAIQYGQIDPEGRGSMSTMRVLGGVRGFVLPAEFPLRPWGGILAGWGHYDRSGGSALPGIIAFNREKRDDVMVSAGGGLEWRLHPNFEIGANVRYDVSFTDDGETGEEDLKSVSVLGVLLFNY